MENPPRLEPCHHSDLAPPPTLHSSQKLYPTISIIYIKGKERKAIQFWSSTKLFEIQPIV